jgi:hypothetical protein
VGASTVRSWPNHVSCDTHTAIRRGQSTFVRSDGGDRAAVEFHVFIDLPVFDIDETQTNHRQRIIIRRLIHTQQQVVLRVMPYPYFDNTDYSEFIESGVVKRARLLERDR